MATLKFVDQHHWDALEEHLTSGRGERFAFAHTRVLTTTADGPVLAVIGIELMSDAAVTRDKNGWYLNDEALDQVHNAAVAGGFGLVEFHNHRLGPPAFSQTDEAGLTPMADYVTCLLPNRPYGAAVYTAGRLHAECWTRTADGLSRAAFRSVTVLGQPLRNVNATPAQEAARLQRQAQVLGQWGTVTLTSLRIAIVGAGGTGSQVALALAYLGAGDLLILDDDHIELTNLNRLVTAGYADIGAPKNLVARRRMRDIDTGIDVMALPALTPDGAHPELHDADLIIGCVDHDGARDRLNQIAVDTATPYIDIATGIDSTSAQLIAGGRVIFVTPGGPCLHCHRELDPGEITRWSKDPVQQVLDRQHGYGVMGANPSVVHLNGLAANAAIAELVAWISGRRWPAQYIDIDLFGFMNRSDGPHGSRVAPRHPVGRRQGCISCETRLRNGSFDE
jgi:molybdopterin/thiamine biosynthesis adenylyltransferase